MKNDENILNQNSNLKHENPFKVPENYFDTFIGKLQSKISLQNEPKQVSLFPIKLKHYFSYAFLIAGIALIAYLSINTLSPYIKSKTLTSDEIVKYFDSHAMEIDEALILDEMNIKNLDQGSSQGTNDTINYLINNNLSEEELVSSL
jgi:hypothetical protein